MVTERPGPSIAVLRCGRPPRALKNGWEFPRAVERLLLKELDGMTVLHLFGGRARFGIRIDIDPSTRPHVIADAFLAPFAKDSFDAVVLDPPYTYVNGQVKSALFAQAAFIARRYVVWFHTLWCGSCQRCRLERAWLVAPGRSAVVRCLQFFRPPDTEQKLPPLTWFTRGPAIKYNRWLHGPPRLPFPDYEHTSPEAAV